MIMKAQLIAYSTQRIQIHSWSGKTALHVSLSTSVIKILQIWYPFCDCLMTLNVATPALCLKAREASNDPQSLFVLLGDIIASAIQESKSRSGLKARTYHILSNPMHVYWWIQECAYHDCSLSEGQRADVFPPISPLPVTIYDRPP